MSLLVFFGFLLLSTVSGGGVTKCYSCSGQCYDLMSFSTCKSEPGIDYVCISFETVKNGTVAAETKGCYPVSAVEESCDDDEPPPSCYTCDKDLCNGRGTKRRGVQQCYFCNGTCSNPLEVETCPSSEDEYYVCLASATTTNGITVETRGCRHYTEELYQHCDSSYPNEDNFCYLCGTDLCEKDGADHHFPCFVIYSTVFLLLRMF